MTAREDQPQKLPIDRPCSACSAGDYDMEYHDHHPPFSKLKDQPRPTPPICKKCGQPETEQRFMTGKGKTAPSGTYRCWPCATKEAEENWTPADNPSQIMCMGAAGTMPIESKSGPTEAQSEAPQNGTFCKHGVLCELCRVETGAHPSQDAPCPTCGSGKREIRERVRPEGWAKGIICDDAWHDPASSPEIEKFRRQLMRKFADRCSMEQIATAAYILAGARSTPSPDPQEEK